LGALASRLARAKDGADNAPWKTKKPFSTFAPARRLDVRIEESWLKSKAVSMVGGTGAPPEVISE